MGKLAGRDAVVGFLTSILPAVKGVQIKQHIVEGDFVATVFEMETMFGVDQVFDRVQVCDGELKETQSFYSSLAIKEIGWSVGYEDYGAFRKVFLKIMGLSPENTGCGSRLGHGRARSLYAVATRAVLCGFGAQGHVCSFLVTQSKN